jgi:CDGSH-type Zn-finger protein
MADVKVTIFDDGPYEIVGPVTLTTESGKVIEVEAGEPVYLCRCGGSADKPFCDGTHSSHDWDCRLRHPIVEN